jgi:regulator of protease activity HflC (stomatin/prohibitin superfamily)
MKSKKLLCCLLLATVVACSKVPAGNVGIKVNLLGSSKGVETEELGVGRHWIGINEELYIFPTFTQNYNWTRSKTEGSKNDESITFQTTEGLSVNADIGISYSLEKDKVNILFQKYRKGIDEITDIYMRNMVRDAFVVAASKRKVETVYGSGKADLLKEVEETVRKQVAGIGINIERIYFVGELRLPNTVVKALNSKIEATQRAQQRENEVAEAEAEALKQIAEAKGKLEVARLEAKSITVRGNALRNNSSIIKMKELEVKEKQIEKWNGTMPTHVLGDKTMMLLRE